jgi:acetyl esterase/lipase
MNADRWFRFASGSTFLSILMGATLTLAAEHSPPTIELWPEGAPGATGTTDEDRPAITAYLPDRTNNTGAAVLICPGGGFMTRAVDHEGVLVAQWFKQRGVAGFVLRYRIRPVYTTNESLLDAQRGLRYVRTHAGEFQIDPNRIGIIGFSAGAALASGVALKAQPGESDAKDPIDQASSQVAFQILAYGSPGLLGPDVSNRDDSAARRPTDTDWKSSPPTFLFGTTEDSMMIRRMADLYANLSRANVPVEAHFFAHGVHGVGFAQGDPVLGSWPELMWRWLRAGGFLTSAQRVAIRGVVTVDGEPLARGCVILTPLDTNALVAPPVVAYVVNTGPERGEFMAPASQGPTPGRYRAEIRQHARRWVSNSRDPVMSTMSAKSKDGTLTEAERRAWMDYARKRNLSPSITEERVFRSKRPDEPGDMIVEIKSDRENRIDLEVFSR